MDVENQVIKEFLTTEEQEELDLKQYMDDVLQLENYTIDDIEQCEELLISQDNKKILKALITIDTLVDIDESVKKKVINDGWVPMLIDLIKNQQGSIFVHEICLQVIINLCYDSLELTEEFIKHDIIGAALPYITHPQEERRIQIVQLYTIIAQTSDTNRDLIISSGFIGIIVEFLKPLMQAKEIFSTKIMKCFEKLCTGRPRPIMEEINPLIDVCTYVLKSKAFQDQSIFSALQCLITLSDGIIEQIQLIINAKIEDKLVEYLSHKKKSIVLSSLYIIGNITSGSEAQTKKIINTSNCLQMLFNILDSEVDSFRRQSLWALSNVVAEEDLVDRIIDNTKILYKIKEMALNEKIDVAKSAFSVFNNVIFNGNQNRMLKLIDCGVLRVYARAIYSEDVQAINAGIKGIDNLLQASQQMTDTMQTFNKLKDILELNGYLEQIKKLAEHDNYTLEHRCQLIINTFFNYLNE